MEIGGHVDYDQARQIGDAGEARVAAALEALRLKYNFSVLHDVLLVREQTKGKPITAQLDHVVIDAMGVLVIETKVRTNAQLRGTYADSKWTACYPNGSKATFQNPLRQNEQHLNLLHQLLKEFHPELPLDSVRGCVVFIDADISHLELDSITHPRVQRIEDLASWFHKRYAFETRTPLDRSEQAALGSNIVRLDRSTDEAALLAHSAYRGTNSPKAGASAASPARRYQPPKPVARAGASAPQSGSGLRTALIVAAVVVAISLIVWVILGVMNRTTPTWVWALVFVVLAAVGGEAKGGRRRRNTRRKSSSASAPRSFGQVLAQLGFALALFAVIVLAGGWFFQAMVQSLANSAARSIPSVTAPAVPARATMNVPQAKQALQASMPNIYAELTHPDGPTVAAAGPNVSYEWQYLNKTSSASVQVRRIQITLDASGKIVGLRQQ